MSAIAEGRRAPSGPARGWPARALMALAGRCLSPDPDDRPEDGRELLVELRRIRRRRTSFFRVRGFRSRTALLATSLALVIAALAAITAMVGAGAGWMAPRDRSGTPHQPQRLSPARTLAVEIGPIALSAAGNELVTTTKGGTELWQRPLGPGRAFRIGRGPGRIDDLVVGPEGGWVLLEALDARSRSWIWEMPASGGPARKVLQGEMPAIDGSGQRLCVVRRRPDRTFDIVCSRRNGTEARVVTTLPGEMAPMGLCFAPRTDAETQAPEPDLVMVLSDGVRASSVVLVALADGRRTELVTVEGIALPGIAVSGRHRAAIWCLRPVARQGSMVVATPIGKGAGQGAVHVVYPGPGWISRPSLDPGESRLALAITEHSSRLERLRVDPEQPEPGTGLMRLAGSEGASQPRISPDGSRLLFLSGLGHLWVMGLDREDPDEVIAEPLQRTGESSFNPGWSPDGRLVVYAAVQDNASRLWIAGVDGGEPEPITPAEHSSFQPVWHRDGQHILMVSDRDGIEDLYQIDLHSGSIIRLNHDGAANPSISPAGDLVAFSSPRDGTAAMLRLSRLDAKQAMLETVWERPIRCTPRAGAKPRFSPDGRWLAFDGPDEEGGADIFVVRVVDPPTVPPRLLVDLPAGTDVLRWFDWGPDGTVVAALTERRSRAIILDDATTLIGRALR